MVAVRISVLISLDVLYFGHALSSLDPSFKRGRGSAGHYERGVMGCTCDPGRMFADLERHCVEHKVQMVFVSAALRVGVLVRTAAAVSVLQHRYVRHDSSSVSQESFITGRRWPREAQGRRHVDLDADHAVHLGVYRVLGVGCRGSHCDACVSGLPDIYSVGLADRVLSSTRIFELPRVWLL